MSLRAIFGRVAVVLALLGAVLMGSAGAQVLNSATSAISLQAVLTQSLSVTLSGNSVNFTLTAGKASNPGSTSITATTTWALRPNVGSVKLYAFFGSSASAMTDGVGDNIPSADVEISDNGGPFAALNGTVPFGGANAGLLLSTTPILGNNKTGFRSDVMNFNIDLSTLPNLPAGGYTGTLTVQAQAI